MMNEYNLPDCLPPQWVKRFQSSSLVIIGWFGWDSCWTAYWRTWFDCGWCGLKLTYRPQASETHGVLQNTRHKYKTQLTRSTRPPHHYLTSWVTNPSHSKQQPTTDDSHPDAATTLPYPPTILHPQNNTFATRLSSPRWSDMALRPKKWEKAISKSLQGKELN